MDEGRGRAKFHVPSGKGKRSEAWDYFAKTTGCDKTVTCKLCGKALSLNAAITKLKRHFNSCPRKEELSEDDWMRLDIKRKARELHSLRTSGAITTPSPASRYQYESVVGTISNAIGSFILSTGLSVNAVDSKHFTELLDVLAPGITNLLPLPLSNHIYRTQWRKAYVNQLDLFESFLDQCQTITLSIDCIGQDSEVVDDVVLSLYSSSTDEWRYHSILKPSPFLSGSQGHFYERFAPNVMSILQDLSSTHAKLPLEKICAIIVDGDDDGKIKEHLKEALVKGGLNQPIFVARCLKHLLYSLMKSFLDNGRPIISEILDKCSIISNFIMVNTTPRRLFQKLNGDPNQGLSLPQEGDVMSQVACISTVLENRATLEFLVKNPAFSKQYLSRLRSFSVTRKQADLFMKVVKDNFFWKEMEKTAKAVGLCIIINEKLRSKKSLLGDFYLDFFILVEQIMNWCSEEKPYFSNELERSCEKALKEVTKPILILSWGLNPRNYLHISEHMPEIVLSLKLIGGDILMEDELEVALNEFENLYVPSLRHMTALNDVKEFWEAKRAEMPSLSQIARCIIKIPATTMKGCFGKTISRHIGSLQEMLSSFEGKQYLYASLNSHIQDTVQLDTPSDMLLKIPMYDDFKHKCGKEAEQMI